MKIFDFECSRVGCDNRFEVFTDADDQPEQCPECKAPAIRLLGGRPAKSPGSSHRDGDHYESPDFDQSKVNDKHFDTKVTPIMDLGCAGENSNGDHVHLALGTVSRVPKNKA